MLLIFFYLSNGFNDVIVLRSCIVIDDWFNIWINIG